MCGGGGGPILKSAVYSGGHTGEMLNFFQVFTLQEMVEGPGVVDEEPSQQFTNHF